MKNNNLILDTFNKILSNNFFDEKELKITDLKIDNIQDNKFNDDENNIFDSVLDILVFSIGAIYKLEDLTQIKTTSLAKSNIEFKTIERIITWNKKRNLNVFNFRRELAFIVEEVYEGTFLNHFDSHKISLEIVDKYFFDLIISYQTSYLKLQFFFIDIYKNYLVLGKKIATYYENEDVFFYLNKVMDANDLKGSKKDSNGKVIKDHGSFVAPEKSFIKK